MGRSQPWDEQLWVKLYESAVLEIGADEVRSKIQLAEAAISTRFLELAQSPDQHESDALRKASRVLKLIAEGEDWIKRAG